MEKTGWKQKVSFFGIGYLNELKAMYENEGNGVFVWLAYSFARELIKKNYDFAIPEWILNYFDDSAANLNNLLSIEATNDMAPKITSALELYAFGQSSIITNTRNSWERFYTVQMVLNEMQMNPTWSKQKIFRKVAGEVSKDRIIETDTIKNWYYGFRRKYKLTY